MEAVFFDPDHRLRNGWWVLIFILTFALIAAGLGPLTTFLKHAGVARFVAQPLPFLVTLLATWICTRLRREPLASVGFNLNRRWAQEAAWGTLLGIGLMLAAAALAWAFAGVHFGLEPARSLKALGAGFYFFLLVGLFEETLFRGFLFQRLADGGGVWVAQGTLALFFALAHWRNPGMVGATKVWATLCIALAAVLLGLAYLRTRSLALPVGIHLGWNWAQGNVLGFGVSGGNSLGWFKPQFTGRPDWLTGGAFGLEASVFGSLVVLLGIALLWRWRPTPSGPRLK